MGGSKRPSSVTWMMGVPAPNTSPRPGTPTTIYPQLDHDTSCAELMAGSTGMATPADDLPGGSCTYANSSKVAFLDLNRSFSHELMESL